MHLYQYHILKMKYNQIIMELGQKGKGRTFKLYRDVPKCYKATAADTARFEKFLKIMIKKTTKAIGKNLTR